MSIQKIPTSPKADDTEELSELLVKILTNAIIQKTLPVGNVKLHFEYKYIPGHPPVDVSLRRALNWAQQVTTPQKHITPGLQDALQTLQQQVRAYERRGATEEEITKKRQDIVSIQQKINEEAQMIQTKTTDTVKTQVDKIIRKLSKQNGYNLYHMTREKLGCPDKNYMDSYQFKREPKFRSDADTNWRQKPSRSDDNWHQVSYERKNFASGSHRTQSAFTSGSFKRTDLRNQYDKPSRQTSSRYIPPHLRNQIPTERIEKQEPKKSSNLYRVLDVDVHGDDFQNSKSKIKQVGTYPVLSELRSKSSTGTKLTGVWANQASNAIFEKPPTDDGSESTKSPQKDDFDDKQYDKLYNIYPIPKPSIRRAKIYASDRVNDDNYDNYNEYIPDAWDD